MSKVLSFIKKEFVEALPAIIFFFAMGHLAAITKALLLEEYGITATGTAVSTALALIVAKAILIADKLPLINVFRHRPRVYTVVLKTIFYGLITLVFRFIEETVQMIFKYGNVRNAVEHLVEEVSWPHFWVIQLWLVTSLVLFCIGSALVDEFGAARVKKALFASPQNLWTRVEPI
jgi:hypothetical protein